MPPDYLFGLRVHLHDATLYVAAFEGGFQEPNHTRIDVEAWLVKDGKRTCIWYRGQTWCGVPSHQSIDGVAAKECVLATLAMKPGDTDADYFASYTEEQLAFANEYGEELSMIREERYGNP